MCFPATFVDNFFPFGNFALANKPPIAKPNQPPILAVKKGNKYL
jgi:hypothetical protein